MKIKVSKLEYEILKTFQQLQAAEKAYILAALTTDRLPGETTKPGEYCDALPSSGASSAP